MLPQEVIAECRRAYQIDGARWPVPLIAYLDEPPNERRVFDWLASCSNELLDRLGGSNVELKAFVALARRSATEESSLESIERTAWELCSNRASGPEAQTAVAQLLFALLAHRQRRENYRGSCATPVMLLERLAAHRDELRERRQSTIDRLLGPGLLTPPTDRSKVSRRPIRQSKIVAALDRILANFSEYVSRQCMN
jgi:hypothetical protein